jgi:hypothetical protein
MKILAVIMVLTLGAGCATHRPMQAQLFPSGAPGALVLVKLGPPADGEDDSGIPFLAARIQLQQP